MYYNYADLNYINRELTGVWPGWVAVKLLGRGSFGAVYEIQRNIRSNIEIAAMKVLRVPENEMEIMQLRAQGISRESTEVYYEKLVDSIQNEIRIMQKLIGNSHLVSYEDYSIRKRYNEIGWDIYIRMELLTGLPDYIEMNPLTDKMALKLGLDISRGLCDCHMKGIIHRDIKPQNIFVNDTESFKLGDFGISRTAPGRHDVLSFKGTLAYMAPEVYRMESTDVRSDIYSLGVVLYQSLNDNRLPFVPKQFTPEDIEIARQRRLAGEPIPDPVHGSYRFRSIVKKAMAEKPEDRFQTAKELYYALMETYLVECLNTSIGGYNNLPGKRNDTFASKDTILLFENAEKRLAAPVEINSIRTIDWKDDALEAKMRSITGIQFGDITYNDVKDITRLNLSNQQDANADVKIKDIRSLMSLTKLQELNLSNNQITDIKPLRFLKRLRKLNLSDNQIRDIRALSGLNNLIALNLMHNPIDDYSPLNSLRIVLLSTEQKQGPQSTINRTEWNTLHSRYKEFATNPSDHVMSWKDDVLERKMRNITGIHSGDIMYSDVKDILSIDLSNESNSQEDARIKDISSLMSLTKLKELNLSNNRISDIKALRFLKKLQKLDLSGNQISDIRALGGLKNLYVLKLKGNPITDYSPIEHINIVFLIKY